MATFTGTNAAEAITPVFVSASVVRVPWTFPGNAADFVYGYGGDDLITTLGGADIVWGGDGDDDINGGDGADTLYGNDDDDTINGDDGDDTISGGTGDDWLYGGDGDDTLVGGSGRDYLSGGADADEMRGDAGNDGYWVDDAGDVVIEFAGEGVDTVDSEINYTLTANVEDLNLIGAATEGVGNGLGNDIVGYELGVDYVLRGMGGADDLFALGNGDDTLFGGGGSDSLFGDVGDDVLRGQSGVDFLDGGSGADQLIGGEGDDIFVFFDHTDSTPGAATRDRIVAGDGAGAFQGAGAGAGDRIDVSEFDADLTLSGDQPLFWGGAGAGAIKSKGFLWVEGSGGDSYVRANLDNDAALEFEVRIVDGGVNASAYGQADFILM